MPINNFQKEEKKKCCSAFWLSTIVHVACLLPVQLDVVAKRNRNPVSLYKIFRQKYILFYATAPSLEKKKSIISNKPGF